MDQLTAHRRAQDVFAGVLANVRPDQLKGPTPCAEWTVTALIDHVIGGNVRVAAMAGAEADGPSEDLVKAHAASALASHAAFAAPEGLTRTYELPFGSIPGSVFIGLRTTDVVTHAWDLARATRQSSDLDPELAAAMLETARGLMNPAFRGPGRAFGDERPCEAGRPAADQLAAFLGREVG